MTRKRKTLLQKIDAFVEGLLGKAHQDRLFSDEAINWEDLHCVEVLDVEGSEGQKFIQVEIEEASPDCWQLNQWIGKCLEEEFHESFRVNTKW